MKASKYIDHTLLKPDATAADIERLCQEAKESDFACVCVRIGQHHIFPFPALSHIHLRPNFVAPMDPVFTDGK